MTQSYLDFGGKVVLITGSTRGIGRAIAECFGEYGATVIINSRHLDNVSSVIEEFKAKGYKVDGIAADIGNEKEVEEMVNKIGERFGRFDVLINNAAIRETGDIEIIDKEAWRRVWQSNVEGTFSLSKFAAEIMKRNSKGVIINITSSSAIFGRGMMSRDGSSAPAGVHYVVSKGAIFSLTRALAWELSKFGIRVNAVMPSMIRSSDDLETNLTEVEKWQLWNTPLKRFGSPEEVAKVCLFLASDLASYVTGEVIALGGYIKPGIDL